MKEKTHYYKKEIKEMGFTDGAITKFLGDPDEVKKNRNYGGNAVIKLWECGRVDKVVKSKKFKEWFDGHQEKRQKLSKASTIRAEAAKATLIENATDEVIDLPDISYNRLIKLSLLHYVEHKNDFCFERELDDYVTLKDVKDASNGFKHRIAFNYIRHICSQYELKFLQYKGQVGKYEAMQAYRLNLVKTTISKWPQLKGACKSYLQQNSQQDALKIAMLGK